MAQQKRPSKPARKNAPQRNAPQRNAPQRNAPQYDNNMRGVLFLNNRKTTEKHPDVTGSCEIDGVEYWISGWKNASKNGVKFTSLSFTAKDDQSYHQQSDFDDQQSDIDDLPF